MHVRPSRAEHFIDLSQRRLEQFTSSAMRRSALGRQSETVGTAILDTWNTVDMAPLLETLHIARHRRRRSRHPTRKLRRGHTFTPRKDGVDRELIGVQTRRFDHVIDERVNRSRYQPGIEQNVAQAWVGKVSGIGSGR